MDFSVIPRLFPELTNEQTEQLRVLGPLYEDWNAKINVISRKDIDRLYIAHVAHSLSIARFLGPLAPDTTMLDVGTGGGFPGIPLAIYYPECQFHLIDRIGKKIRVATEVAATVGLKNVTLQHGDVNECRKRFDYVVSRAVMPLNYLWRLTARCLYPTPRHANRYAPGLICLKGGDLSEELKGIRNPVWDYPVCEFLPDPSFDTKQIVYVGI